MRVFNTLTRTKEELIPITPGEIKMYVCGPTVYNFFHVGNARVFCVFDTLRRYLEYRGLKVTFVQNFTDIDDKIINKAKEEGVPYTEISERYIQEYWTDAKGLGLRPATHHPRATENISEIISIVQSLEERGFAYAVNGDVYFRTKKDPGYGKLSHMNLDDLDAGNRIDVNSQKEDAMDFVLWKAAKPGEPAWESPWGQGRPGWHIECTAMIRRYLGQPIDLHCGGQDLVFPHHENEIAQGECSCDSEYVHYWMHNGFINVDNQKMSKSLHNFFTTREVAQKYGYEPIKFLMLQAHYRSPINYSLEIVEQCKAALERLHTCRDNLDFALGNASETVTEGEEELRARIEGRRAQFVEAMDDDLNTADGIAAMFDLVRDSNIAITEQRSKGLLQMAADLFDELADVLGLLYNRGAGKSLDAEVEDLIAQRQAARKAKDWAKADAIRDQLAGMGVELKDTPQGIQWTLSK